MKNFIAVMKWDGDNRVSKYQDFDTDEEAQAHISNFPARFPNAFSIPKPNDSAHSWLVDPVAKTVSIDFPVIVPPTDEERIDAAFPQTDVARVLFEVIWQFSNEIEALKTGVVFNPATPIFTRAQVKNRLKSMLP